MKVRIYDEPRGEALGGTEVYAAVLAGALAAEGHSVEILHHRPKMTSEGLARFANVDLGDAQCIYVPPAPIVRGRALHSWRRYREEQEQELKMSSDCDLFISLNHETLPFCAAPLGVMIVLFPFYDPRQLGDEVSSSSARATMRAKLRTLWHTWKLRKRWRSYRVRTAISEFSRKWTKQRWGVACEILYPPVELDSPAATKSDRILSVGRFATGRHGKNQLEMLEIFGRLKKDDWPNWRYDCVGARGFSPDDVSFFEQAQTLAGQVGADVTANLDRAHLGLLYRDAKIFWHAAGMKSDETIHPELAEHFGISTVEAMSAGCVPVVVNKGGQPEIVEHGVSGFVWNTIDELKDYTTRLMTDEGLWRQMSQAAQIRAQKFSRQAFFERFQQLVAPHVNVTSGAIRVLESATTR